MSAFKGTPGPWFIDGGNVGAEFNVDSADGGTSIGITSPIFRDNGNEIRRANTQLIAVAPSLLAACLRIQSQFRKRGVVPMCISINTLEEDAFFLDEVIYRVLGREEPESLYEVLMGD